MGNVRDKDSADLIEGGDGSRLGQLVLEDGLQGFIRKEQFAGGSFKNSDAYRHLAEYRFQENPFFIQLLRQRRLFPLRPAFGR